MHEMSILTNVVDIVLKYAEDNGAERVCGVSLVVGEMRDVVDELMESCFQFLCRDTIAEGATLSMTKVPARAQCGDCKLVFPVDVHGKGRPTCPDCGSGNLTIKTGREFLIQSIEIA